MVRIDFSFILGGAYYRSLINIHTDDAITQGRCSREPKTTPTEDQGSEGFPPTHPLPALGQERCAGPAPAPALAPALPHLLAMSFG